MAEVLNGSCPLCTTAAPYQPFNGHMAAVFNCPRCGVFAISSGAQQRINESSFLRSELQKDLPQVTCESGEVRFIHIASGNALSVTCIQAP